MILRSLKWELIPALLCLLGLAYCTRHPEITDIFQIGSEFVIDYRTLSEAFGTKKLPSKLTFMLKQILPLKGRAQAAYKKEFVVSEKEVMIIELDQLLDAGVYQQYFVGPVVGEEDGELKNSVCLDRPIRIQHATFKAPLAIHRSPDLVYRLTLAPQIKQLIGPALIFKLHRMKQLDVEITPEDDKDLPYEFIGLDETPDIWNRDTVLGFDIADSIYDNYGHESFFVAAYAIEGNSTNLRQILAQHSPHSEPVAIKGCILLGKSALITFNSFRRPEIEKGQFTKINMTNVVKEGKSKTLPPVIINSHHQVLYQQGDKTCVKLGNLKDKVKNRKASVQFQNPNLTTSIVVKEIDFETPVPIKFTVSDLYYSGYYGCQVTLTNGQKREYIHSGKPILSVAYGKIKSPKADQVLDGNRTLDVVFEIPAGGKPSHIYYSGFESYEVSLIMQDVVVSPGEQVGAFTICKSGKIDCRYTNELNKTLVHIPMRVSGVPEEAHRNHFTILIEGVKVNTDQLAKTKTIEKVPIALSDKFSICDDDKKGMRFCCINSVCITPKLRLISRGLGSRYPLDIFDTPLVSPSLQELLRKSTKISVLVTKTLSPIRSPRIYRHLPQSSSKLTNSKTLTHTLTPSLSLSKLREKSILRLASSSESNTKGQTNEGSDLVIGSDKTVQLPELDIEIRIGDCIPSPEPLDWNSNVKITRT